ncbi:MAG: hypothetical protein RI571_15850 [Roseovarius sp.]|nr:hypothetical protein [Roseovarius sp.]
MCDERITTITITDAIEDTGPAFGWVLDSEEKVYITAKTRQIKGAEIGDDWKAVVKPNRQQPDKTPWFAPVLLRKVNEPAEVDHD